MNAEKLKQLQANVRIGGKGTVRRKKKVVHRTATTDDKKLQSSLKKLSVNNIPGIEEVNMIKDDGTVIHFNNPKVQASLQSNTFAVTGHAENKQITEMLPGILNQLGAESLTHLKRLASNVGGATGLEAAAEGGDDDDDEVPDLVENFDEASKDEKATEDVKVPEEEVKAPEEEVKAPEEEVKAPEEEVKAPEEEVKAPEEEVKAPEEEVKAPEEEAKIEDVKISEETPAAGEAASTEE